MLRRRGSGVALLMLLCGCSVGSVGPYYQPAQVTLDTTLLGTWVESDSRTRAEFRPDGDR